MTWTRQLPAGGQKLAVESKRFRYYYGVSVKYPLVYGSLAALILLMVWFYFNGLVFFCGAALNICIRDGKEAEDPR